MAPVYWSEQAEDYLLYGSHENYWNLTSCDSKVTDLSCPCNKCHLLHYKKEPLVHYCGEIWALKCAIYDMSHQFQRTRERNEELAFNNGQLKDLCKQNSERVGYLVQVFKGYTYHHEDCEVVQVALSGRILNSKCTCGYDSELKHIDQLQIYQDTADGVIEEEQ